MGLLAEAFRAWRLSFFAGLAEPVAFACGWHLAPLGKAACAMPLWQRLGKHARRSGACGSKPSSHERIGRAAPSLRDALAALLFRDADIEAARAERTSPVAKTEPLEAVNEKKATKRAARRSESDELRGPHRSSRHLHPQRHARAVAPKAPVHPPFQANPAPGGRLQTA
jgi:hypothetical protein